MFKLELVTSEGRALLIKSCSDTFIVRQAFSFYLKNEFVIRLDINPGYVNPETQKHFTNIDFK
jgi:hypothetical protein